MKKLFGIIGIAFVGLVTLSSCKNSQDLKTLRVDEVSTTNKEKYNLNFDADNEEEAIRLYNSERSAKTTSYYDVYIAKDYKSSLLSYTITLDELKEELSKEKIDLDKKLNQKKFKSLHVTSMFFYNEGASLYSDEQTAFIKEIYNSKYGITSTYKDDSKNVVKNYDFGFDIDSKAQWDRTFKTNYVNEAYLDGKTDISFTFVYLPMFLRRVYKGETIVEKYVFLPINEAALYDGKQIVAPTEKGQKYSLADYELSVNAGDFVFDEETKMLSL